MENTTKTAKKTITLTLTPEQLETLRLAVALHHAERNRDFDRVSMTHYAELARARKDAAEAVSNAVHAAIQDAA
jgi:hypothetical protein